MLVLTGLPEPDCNLNAGDDVSWLGRVDMAYRGFNVVVEYDGRGHDDDSRRNADVLRLEALQQAGWTVIVLRSGHLAHPRQATKRVYRALANRGYIGPEPVFSDAWSELFERGSGRVVQEMCRR